MLPVLCFRMIEVTKSFTSVTGDANRGNQHMSCRGIASDLRQTWNALQFGNVVGSARSRIREL